MLRDYSPEYESFRDDALATIAVTGFWWKPVFAGPIALAVAVLAYALSPRSKGGTIVAVLVITLVALLGRWLAGYSVV
jgi:hypothetical protein